MKILVERDVKAPNVTLGRMYIDGQFFCYTCEDEVREKPGIPVEHWKIPGASAIPKGAYRVIITFSQRFQKHLPLLLDVPGFAGVRIHNGNFSGDTEGCVLLGTGRVKGGVSNSRLAMSIFMPMLESGLKDGAVCLEIR